MRPYSFGDGLLDLHDQVGLAVDRVRVRQELRARPGVLLVGDAAALAGALLHVDAVAVAGEDIDALRAPWPRGSRWA
jgi:hypothetical protein